MTSSRHLAFGFIEDQRQQPPSNLCLEGEGYWQRLERKWSPHRTPKSARSDTGSTAAPQLDALEGLTPRSQSSWAQSSPEWREAATARPQGQAGGESPQQPQPPGTGHERTGSFTLSNDSHTKLGTRKSSFHSHVTQLPVTTSETAKTQHSGLFFPLYSQIFWMRKRHLGKSRFVFSSSFFSKGNSNVQGGGSREENIFQIHMKSTPVAWTQRWK